MTKKKENSTSDGYFSKNHKKRFNKKVFFIVIVAVVIILVVSGAAFLIIKLRNNENISNIDNSNAETSIDDIVKKQAVIAKKVENLTTTSGPDSAQEYLNNELENATSVEEKAQLYISKSVLASSLPGGQDYSRALEYAMEADKLYPTDETALMIANIEKNQNNIPNAIKYYNLYLNRTPKGSNGEALDGSGYDYYYKLIEELEAEI